MKTFARIENGIVVELLELGDDLNIKEMFHPEMVWVECDATVKQGWTWGEGKFSAPANPQPTQAQVEASLVAALQELLDTTAQARGYDGILSLCSYATSTSPKFGAEGKAGVAWRDAVWAAGYAIMADVQAGKISVPTAPQLVASMPNMVWSD
jgi:hypothetical protein